MIQEWHALLGPEVAGPPGGATDPIHPGAQSMDDEVDPAEGWVRGFIAKMARVLRKHPVATRFQLARQGGVRATAPAVLHISRQQELLNTFGMAGAHRMTLHTY